jgi:tetratricopeptide (TPR) repeat protein
VVRFFNKSALAVIAVGCLAAGTAFAQDPWKDRAEYDLYESIRKEQNPQTRLGLLESYRQKYPDTKQLEFVLQTLVSTYQQLGRGKEMFNAAKDLVAASPKNVTGLYWLNLFTISNNDNAAAALDLGEKAGKGLLGVLDETFAPAKKPQGVADEQWKKDKDNMTVIGLKTLGWVAMNRNQHEESEKQFLAALKLNENDAQLSYWIGTEILKQRKVERQSVGLYHLVHAAHHSGQGALPDATRKQLEAFVERSYVNFHGDRGGLDELIATTTKSPVPPADFKIESKDEILLKQEEELKKSNPMLALWVSIKRELAKEGGAGYFEERLKNTKIPGGAEVAGTKVEKFKGKVVAVKAGKPRGIKEVVLGISSAEMSEVTLRFENPVAGAVEPGLELEFGGVPVEFIADPFNVVFDVEQEDIIGWPKAAPLAAPAKKAPAKAPAAKKK